MFHISWTFTGSRPPGDGHDRRGGRPALLRVGSLRPQCRPVGRQESAHRRHALSSRSRSLKERHENKRTPMNGGRLEACGKNSSIVQGWPNFLDRGPFSEIWTKARATPHNSIFSLSDYLMAFIWKRKTFRNGQRSSQSRSVMVVRKTRSHF